MTRLIDWEGEPFALLIESPHGHYLVPPIVLDQEGRPIEGREVLAAIVESGVAARTRNVDPFDAHEDYADPWRGRKMPILTAAVVCLCSSS
jgi:hypothetical protein